MNVKKLILAAAGYTVVTFVFAAWWHLGLFKSLYDELNIFTREEPILALGALATVLQGLVMAYVYPFCSEGRGPVSGGLRVGLLMGVFLGSYGVLVEAAKLEVSSLSTWIILESLYYFVQFSAAGLVVGAIYGKSVPAKAQ